MRNTGAKDRVNRGLIDAKAVSLEILLLRRGIR